MEIRESLRWRVSDNPPGPTKRAHPGESSSDAAMTISGSSPRAKRSERSASRPAGLASRLDLGGIAGFALTMKGQRRAQQVPLRNRLGYLSSLDRLGYSGGDACGPWSAGIRSWSLTPVVPWLFRKDLRGGSPRDKVILEQHWNNQRKGRRGQVLHRIEEPVAGAGGMGGDLPPPRPARRHGQAGAPGPSWSRHHRRKLCHPTRRGVE